MKSFEFVSHEDFPEDPYIKEVVYLCFDNKFRVAYVRKQAKNGGMFWGTISASLTKDNSKVYYDSFMQDSLFLDKDIKSFLDNREWENRINKPQSVSVQEELPF